MESWIIVFLSVFIIVSTIANEVTHRKKLDEAYKRGLSDAMKKKEY
ncbi:hypothetical protein [Lysinibacillus parviboronicapiens]|uniref:Uncharacterized protein n=1 Tax=Lysinibacillus parviboronicapiens TaxID=436516 RepID=A0ABV2PSM3_9BACI|nr:hypothetical protein [Lysinibacillus parviboronicapiens]